MEKVKRILSPGKPVDDETLYGEGQSSGRRRLSKSKGSSPDNAAETSTSSTAGQTTEPSTTATGTDSTYDKTGASPSTPSTAGSSLRPAYPTPASAASNASIKSNVVGRVPSGSALTSEEAAQQKEGDLPPVPATDGKFMGDENTRAFPLAGTASNPEAASSNAHSTVTAPMLDPNLDATKGASESSATHDQHYGRDAGLAGAGLGAGAGALAATHHSDEPNTSTTSSSAIPAQDSQSTVAGTTGTTATTGPASTTGTIGTAGTRDENMNPRSMPGAYPETPAGLTPGQESDRRLGGSGAPQAASGGAAAIAAREAYKRHDPASVHPVEANPYTSTLDPRVGSHTGATSSSTSGTQSSLGQSAGTTSKDTDHHYGRNAAAAGGVGAAGAAAYAASKHHDGKETPTEPQGSFAQKVDRAESREPLQSSTAPVTTGEPQGSFAQKVDDAEAREMAKNNQKDHNYGRDAALAGGAGALGAGAYAANKHHDKEPMSEHTNQPVASHGTRESTHQDPTQSSRIAGQPGPNDVGAPGYTGTAPGQEIGDSHHEKKDHHYGRDAAIAGGTGATGAGVYQAMKHRDDEPSQSSRMAGQPGANDVGAPGYTGTAPGQAIGQPEDEKKDHHYGRDAAIVGGAGAGSAGIYQATKHHDDEPSRVSRLAGQPGKDEVGAPGATGTAPGQAIGQPQEETKDHHYGRDAAAVGGTGAVGYGAYEAMKHHDEKKSKFQEHDTADKEPTNYSRPTGTSHKTTTHEEKKPKHMEDRSHKKEAAETGAAGAGGLGAYEAVKHSHPRGTSELDQSDPLASTANEKALGGYEDQRAMPTHQSHMTGEQPSLGENVHGTKAQPMAPPEEGSLAGSAHRATAGEQPRQSLGENIHGSKAQPMAPPQDDSLVGGGVAQDYETGAREPVQPGIGENIAGSEAHPHAGHAQAAPIVGGGGISAEEYSHQRRIEKEHDKEAMKELKDDYKHGRYHDGTEEPHSPQSSKSHEEKEKKRGLLKRILHRDHKDKHGDDEDRTSRTSSEKLRSSTDRRSEDVPSSSRTEPAQKEYAPPQEYDSPASQEHGALEHSGRNRLHKDPPKDHSSRQ